MTFRCPSKSLLAELCPKFNSQTPFEHGWFLRYLGVWGRSWGACVFVRDCSHRSWVDRSVGSIPIEYTNLISMWFASFNIEEIALAITYNVLSRTASDWALFPCESSITMFDRFDPRQPCGFETNHTILLTFEVRNSEDIQCKRTPGSFLQRNSIKNKEYE